MEGKNTFESQKEDLSISNEERKSFICEACANTYCSYDSLKRHVKNKHPDDINDLAPNLRNGKLYKCDYCPYNYNDMRNLRFHMKKVHSINVKENVRPENEKECPVCSFKGSKTQMHLHFETAHDVKIETTELKFDDFDLFSKWKKNIEKETFSKFIKKWGTKPTKKGITHHFICRRSGYYIPKGKSERYIKTQGSCKMNGYCPAIIKLEINEFGACKVQYCNTHFGHKNDLGHLLLTDEERQVIAGKIASQIPFDSILDEIRSTVSNSQLERIHLLTKKDLYNIEKCFNLGSDAIKHKNDGLSVEAWVNEMKSKEDSCVLFYKPQNILDKMQPELKGKDFVLIIMNEAQAEMLKKYDSHICIDGTHGTNNYDFELITLLVLDDMRQGFPCGFLITNRSDYSVLKIFFSKIKEKVGDISTSVFMSDMADSFYNGWANVFTNKPKHRLYCAWHVDQAWRKNLSKIGIRDTQVEVYKMVRTLMEEPDQESFHIMYENCVERLLADDVTAEFGKYFNEHYGKCMESWAFCYRMRAGLNTNMHIERMHRTVKYIYLKGKHAKRLDKTLHALMKFVKDKLFDRLIALYKGKLSSKLIQLRARHKESQRLSFEQIIEKENSYEVLSSSAKDIYLIEEQQMDCTCPLQCTDCKACLHSFSCT